MENLYIILEYIILENFIINFLILYLSKSIIRMQVSLKRLALGAFLASLYSLVYFLPLRELLLSSLGKFLVSLLIIRVSFDFINLKIFIKSLMAFYISSFVFAGATIATLFTEASKYRFKGMDFGLEEFPVELLFIGVSLSFFACRMIFKYFNIRVIRENYIADVKIYYNKESVNIKALLDTGNSLIEPITRRKVMVVDYKAIADILPYGIEDLIMANEKGDYSQIHKQLDLLKDDFLTSLIPFKSVGSNSTLIGFMPDFIEIKFRNSQKISKDIMIGLYSGSLTKDMGYSGLLNIEMNWGDYDEVSNI